MRSSKKLKRGFKAESERISLSLREAMRLEPYSPLDAFDLANHLKVPIYIPSDFGLSENELEFLLNQSGWSALTMINERKKKIIIHNNNHSAARQQSNIMHELSHIICEHSNAVDLEELHNLVLPTYMREYNEEQEAEAEYLGACLQLPRESLLWALANQNMSKQMISQHYTASPQMVTYRINATGMKYQLRYVTIR